MCHNVLLNKKDYIVRILFCLWGVNWSIIAHGHRLLQKIFFQEVSKITTVTMVLFYKRHRFQISMITQIQLRILKLINTGFSLSDERIRIVVSI